MRLETIRVTKPNGVEFVLGQTRSAEPLDELSAVVIGGPAPVAFAVAYCQPSGRRLVRCVGNDAALVELARANALAIGAGDTFLILVRRAEPTADLLGAIKQLSGVCRIFCATSSPVEVVVAATGQGRGVAAIIDGFGARAIEPEEDTWWRREYLLHISGYRR